ncbi:MAG: class I SAM-dependent methyltransferase [Acidimicrobiales bacterium]
MDSPDWESEAANWLRWSRTVGHDAYWHYRDAFFDRVVPPPGRCTLEVGCGEGRVARDLAARGHRVIGVDRSPTLVRAAADADRAGAYVLADATALPLPDGCADLVVAYNSLMDVDDVATTVGEAARVLAPGGRLCVCITHPCTDTGEFEQRRGQGRLVVTGRYFEQRRFESTVTRDGLTMTFRGWSRSLQDYVGTITASGLLVELLAEPLPAEVPDHLERGRWFPMFLHLRARRA